MEGVNPSTESKANLNVADADGLKLLLDTGCLSATGKGEGREGVLQCFRLGSGVHIIKINPHQLLQTQTPISLELIESISELRL